LQSVKSKD